MTLVTVMTSRGLLGVLAVWSVALNTVGQRGAAIGAEAASSPRDPRQAQVLSVPLVPFHEHRRRLEAQGLNVSQGWSLSRPRRYHRRRDLSQSHDETVEQVVGLFQGYGTHYVDLWCGTPPQRQTVIVDTGSHLTAFPCMGCQRCGAPEYHVDPLFRQDESLTFHRLSCEECRFGSCPWNSIRNESASCEMGLFYREGSSWEAFEAVDRCYIGGLHNQALLEEIQKDTKHSSVDAWDPYHHAVDGSFDFPLVVKPV